MLEIESARKERLRSAAPWRSGPPHRTSRPNDGLQPRPHAPERQAYSNHGERPPAGLGCPDSVVEQYRQAAAGEHPAHEVHRPRPGPGRPELSGPVESPALSGKSPAAAMESPAGSRRRSPRVIGVRGCSSHVPVIQRKRTTNDVGRCAGGRSVRGANRAHLMRPALSPSTPLRSESVSGGRASRGATERLQASAAQEKLTGPACSHRNVVSWSPTPAPRCP
jgi:hypothetical protein